MTTDKPLYCFYDGGDYVIAHSPEDASALYAAEYGPHDDDDCQWEALSPDRMFTASPDEPAGGPMVNAKRQTIAEWIAERGRGWFCTENF